jgi:hypothetical protein
MPTDTASFGVTVTTAGPVPVITSGEDAPDKHYGAEVPATVLAEVIPTIATVDPAIAQAPQGHFLLVDVLTTLGPPEERRRPFDSFLAGGRLGNALAER